MRTIIGVWMLSIAGLTGCAASSRRSPDEAPPLHPPELVTTAATSALDVTKRSGPDTGAITVRASVDDVWEALIATYEELGIPVTTRDLSTRTLGNGELRVRRRLGAVSLATYIDCGETQGGRSAETYEVMVSIYSQIQSAGPNTNRVRSSFQSVGRPVSIASDYRTCRSTGALEKRFGELLRKRLGMEATDATDRARRPAASRSRRLDPEWRLAFLTAKGEGKGRTEGHEEQQIRGNGPDWLLGAEPLAPHPQGKQLPLPFHPLFPRHARPGSCR